MAGDRGLFPTALCDLVVIGASAGGLPTLLRLLKSIPPNFPSALIFVQHLSPQSPSRLSSILSRETNMPVKDAQNQETIRPGILYVSPPDRHLTINHAGVLSLSDTSPVHFQRPSIDLMFESAADAFQDRVVAVVLSGMGSDGSQGILAIKRKGGVVIVEDPNEAIFPGMPASAVQTGKADFVLTVEQIVPKLIQLAYLDKTI